MQQPRFPISRGRALRPRWMLASGAVKTKILEIQKELLDELTTIDDEVQALVWRRQAVVSELRRCRDAFGGVGAKYIRRVPLPDDVDTEPEGVRLLAGRALREAAAMVHAAGRAVTTSEIHRMLLAHGLGVAGHHAKAISDALRAEVVAGRVVRLDRGVYAPPTPETA